MKKKDESGVVYWVLDHEVKVYDVRDVIKLVGCYFDPTHKAWCVKSPNERAVGIIQSVGLKLQFRRHE